MKKYFISFGSSMMYVIVPIILVAIPLDQLKLILVFVTCFIIFQTQPSFEFAEAEKNNSTDCSSIYLIFLSGWLSMIAIMGDWYLYIRHNQQWEILSIVGFVAMIIGIFIRVSAIRKLDKYFTSSVQIKDDHQLIHDGIYEVVRHPSYTGSYISFLGVALFLGSGLGGIVAAILMGAAYWYRIKVEEDVLIQKFGEKYLMYQGKTSRMVPWVW